MTESKNDNPASVDTADEKEPFEQSIKLFYQLEKEQLAPTAKELANLRQLRKQAPEPSSSQSKGWLPLWLPAVLTASFALIFSATWWLAPSTVLKPKGAVWQFLYAQRGAQTKRLLTQEAKDGITLHPRDLIQFAYQISQPTYVAIVSINQQGKIETLLQDKHQKSILLPQGKGALPQEKGEVRAFALDYYIGQERFFVVSALKPFSLKDLHYSLKQAWHKHSDLTKTSDIPGPWKVSTLWIQKKTRQ